MKKTLTYMHKEIHCSIVYNMKKSEATFISNR